MYFRLHAKLFLISLATLAVILSLGFYVMSRAEEMRLHEVLSENSSSVSSLVQENVGHIYLDLMMSRRVLLTIAGHLSRWDDVKDVGFFDRDLIQLYHTNPERGFQGMNEKEFSAMSEAIRTGKYSGLLEAESGLYKRYIPLFFESVSVGAIELVMGDGISNAAGYERSKVARVVELLVSAERENEKQQDNTLLFSRLASKGLGHIIDNMRLQRMNLKSLVERISDIEGIAFLQLSDSDGRVVAGTETGPVGCDINSREVATRKVLSTGETVFIKDKADNKCCIIFPLFCELPDGGSEIAGVAWLATDPGFVEAEMFTLRRNMAVTAAAVTVAMLGMLGLFLRKVVIRPVEELSEMTKAVTTGDLDFKVDIQSTDELGELAASFNRMTLDLRRSRNDLLKSEEKFSKAFRSSPDWISISTLEDGRYIDVNQSFLETTGFRRDEVLGRSSLELGIWAETSEREEAKQELREKGRVLNREVRMRMKSGKAHTMLSSMEIINLGGRECVLSLLRDITERKEAEEKLKASLREKEVLLKEIHHRVKNNLQIVSSILSLQSSHVGEGIVQDVFRVCQDRVRSMALVHEKLYQSRDMARVDFGDYVERLMTNLFRSYGVSRERITLKTDVKEVSLSVDYAVPCGLIINEVVSNSLKYAFPQQREGEISISMKQSGKGVIELEVGDNGVGLPEEVSIEDSGTLGMMLINILGREQLEGEMEVHRQEGCSFRFRFRVRQEDE